MSQQQENESHQTEAEERVSKALDRIRAGVRQRTSELTTLGAGDEHRNLRLAELRKAEQLHEPVPVSPRPGLGRLIVFIRRAVHHLFSKWYGRPLIEQQNRFNRAASAMIEDMQRDYKQLDLELRDLRRRVVGDSSEPE